MGAITCRATAGSGSWGDQATDHRATAGRSACPATTAATNPGDSSRALCTVVRVLSASPPPTLPPPVGITATPSGNVNASRAAVRPFPGSRR